ncbi:molybdenum cofactor biosynthesis protein [Salinadaptatus halalkaliphilus]|uniref:Molybdenum cofactor biosynthesis protein n=1 Tax=Salinadaptatus halalkaliphilus TaxID=2419781 RepID=A0A4S3TSR6_9EURY|nr:molybdopterin-binding protein [Salinadaptatus halalkaliphilus]THE66453.1 molybdenum cofactor biosynthesis protein [Salinadaptatus halalkaliphilus]
MDESDALCIGVVTIATDRSLESDAAGEAIRETMEGDGHEVATREHVVAEHDRVQSIVLRMIERDDVEVVLTAGATSIEPDDVTIEAVEPLLDKTLPTFSELFTTLAAREIGTEIVAMRTFAGVAEGTVICCLPGNAETTRLAAESILRPEANRLVDLAQPAESDDGSEDDDE